MCICGSVGISSQKAVETVEGATPATTSAAEEKEGERVESGM